MNGAERVAQAWLQQGKAKYKLGNVSFDGPVLKSYTTTIGIRYPHFILLSYRWNSKSTRTHKAAARRMAREQGVLVIDVTALRMDLTASCHAENVGHLTRTRDYYRQQHHRFPEHEPYKEDLAYHERALQEYIKRFELQEATA